MPPINTSNRKDRKMSFSSLDFPTLIVAVVLAVVITKVWR